MRREPMIDVQPWVLPVAVVAIMAPIVVAFVLVGPFSGSWPPAWSARQSS